MPTYQQYAAARERTARRASHDDALRVRHAAFDRSAQDQHHKHDRPHFAVVGEGTRTAYDNFARGYDKIRWHDAVGTPTPGAGSLPSAAAACHRMLSQESSA